MDDAAGYERVRAEVDTADGAHAARGRFGIRFIGMVGVYA